MKFGSLISAISFVSSELRDHLGKILIGGCLALFLLWFGAEGLRKLTSSIAVESAIVAVQAMPDVQGYEKEKDAERKKEAERRKARGENTPFFNANEKAYVGALFNLVGAIFDLLGSGINEAAAKHAKTEDPSKRSGLEEAIDKLNGTTSLPPNKKSSPNPNGEVSYEEQVKKKASLSVK